jgi:cytochrome c oxidase subunit 1
LGLPLIGYGLIFNLWWAVPGALLLIAGIYGWVMEPSTEPDAGHGHDDHGHDQDGPESAAAALPEDAGAVEGDATAEADAPAGSEDLVTASVATETTPAGEATQTGDDSNG